MQIRIGLPLRSAWFEWPWGCSRDLEAMQMSRWCANSMRHQPSACAMLRRSAACVVTPEPGERRPARRIFMTHVSLVVAAACNTSMGVLRESMVVTRKV